ncbi:hypothetical protein [Novipirellula rosea]|uniref:Uncharacterized protein n=1 Tax=Novipirellula rosea TaxID=1031540 RepID=A0ABP8NS07_9BACT
MTDPSSPPVQPYQTPPEVKESRRPMRYRTAKLAVLILILMGGGVFAYRMISMMRSDLNMNRGPVDPNWEPIGTRYPPPDDVLSAEEFASEMQESSAETPVP